MERSLGAGPVIGVELCGARLEVDWEVGMRTSFVGQLEMRPGFGVRNDLREDRVMLVRVRATEPCARGKRGERQREAQHSSPRSRF